MTQLFNNANLMSYNYRLVSTFLPYHPKKFPPVLPLKENNNKVSIFICKTWVYYLLALKVTR